MPSISIVQSWLDLMLPNKSEADEVLIFGVPTFVGYQNFPPWENQFSESASAVKTLASSAVELVKDFATRYSSTDSKKKRSEMLKKRKGASDSGMVHATEWVMEALRKWNINKLVDAVLDVEKIMARHKTKKVRNI